MDHHCPPVDHHHAHSPPPCEPSWNTPDHCHPPCPAPPPPPSFELPQDSFWNPAFQPAPFLVRTWNSSSSSDADVPSCTVRVEKPPPATGDKAPLLESKVHGGAAADAGPSPTEALSVLLFWAVIIGGFVYWYWF